jgi:uracil-DNA glycosylase
MLDGAPAGGRLRGSLAAQADALAPAWREALAGVLASSAFARLAGFVDGRVAAGAAVFPPRPFAALADGRPEDVRVVILGQDPYHGAGQAHGYAFSVPPGVRPPPSLRNIRGEVARDCACTEPPGANLLEWPRQGVLLLNTVLTVEEGRPASHAGRGWEILTDALIDALAAQAPLKVFLLWGAQAQAKRARIQAAGPPHLVLCANHPSPLSARRGPAPFIGCGHFSQANLFLAANGRAPVRWCGAPTP